MTEEMVGIIGGTGLGDVLGTQIEDARQRRVRTPFGRCSGPILVGHLGPRKVAFVNRHGEGHVLSPSHVPYAANLFALKSLGVTTVLATGAVGSLRKQIEPRHLVLVDQFIDKTYRRQNTFFEKGPAVHCEFDAPCCGRLRKILRRVAAKTRGMTHEDGTYVCMEGPQFSTRAESLMHQDWGGDLIGMTALPEAKLAREAQMCYALIALVSDYDAWKPHPRGKGRHDLLREIIANLDAATLNAIELIEAVLRLDEPLADAKCACRRSLDLAVWTRQEYIKSDQMERLAVLFK